jgi:predicted DNA binding CopG/RHH family protein
MKKKIPAFKTDKAAERFVDTADLSAYDLSGFTRVQFEFERKTAQLNMRLPKPLLDAVKKHAKARGIPYTRFVREAVERALSRPENRVRR